MTIDPPPRYWRNYCGTDVNCRLCSERRRQSCKQANRIVSPAKEQYTLNRAVNRKFFKESCKELHLSTAANTYSTLSTPSARTVARSPSGPLAPAALHRFHVFVLSSQARPVVSAITLFLLGELHSHARRIACLRATAKSEALLHVTHTGTLQTGVHGQPRSPSGIPFRLGAFVSVTFLILK